MKQYKNYSKHKRLSVYLAGPLFNEAERSYNEMITEKLERWIDVYLPQRDGGLISDMIENGTNPDEAAVRVFRYDMEAIRKATILIAILDGRTIDEGVAFELGIAYSHSKKCIGLQTDSRRLAPWGNNPMITGALEIIFHSVGGLINWVKTEIQDTRKAICPKRNWLNITSDGNKSIL
jgi:nucleoside 2-deoxyribosyltransferase